MNWVAQTAREFKEASFLEKCSKLAFICICLFIFDVSITGSGRYLMLGPLSPRMASALLAFVLCIPEFLKKIHKYITSPVLLMFAVFLGYLLICAVRGLYGNSRMNVLLSDLKGFAWLFLVPVMMAVVQDWSRFDKLLTVILAGAIVQASGVLLVNTLCVFMFHSSQPLEDIFNGCRIGLINCITAQFYRIFMNSSPYMVLACAIALFRQARAKKLMLRYVAAIAMLLTALLISFTRSVYGCVFVVALCAVLGLFVFYREDWKRHIQFLAVTIAATCCLIFSLEFAFNANYLNFAMSRTFGFELQNSAAVNLRLTMDEFFTSNKTQPASVQTQPTVPETQSHTEPEVLPTQAATEPAYQEPMHRQDELDKQQEYMTMTSESDDVRTQTVRELMALIRANPVFGNGLGAYASVREDGLDEYFYLDMLARTGIVGLLLYILPFVWIVIYCLRKKECLVKIHGAVSVLCGMMGFWAITWFNPWMNAVLGITAYALSCTLPQLIYQEQESKKCIL